LDFFLSGGRGNTPPATPAVVPAAPAAADQPGTRESTATSLPDSVPREEALLVAPALLGPSPYQPRRDIAEQELKELADSIRQNGILQPILVRRVGERYEIVAGERRWRAAQLLGLSQVPVLVRAISDDDSAIFGLVENIQREDLNAIEKAKGFQLLQQKLNATQEAVAQKVGMDRSTVANFLRLLDLPEEVQAHVSRGTLTMGHARALLGLADREAILKVAEEGIRLGSSVRALEQRVKELNESVTAPPAPAKGRKGTKSRPVWLNELEESLVEALATKVAIRYSKKRSQILIECAGADEFERVFQRLKNC
jgi:ParB family chromosome partitioning protein